MRRSKLQSGMMVKVAEHVSYYGGEYIEVIEKEGRWWCCVTYRSREQPQEEPDEIGYFLREDLLTEKDQENGYR